MNDRDSPLAAQTAPTDRERWEQELRFKEREFALKDREQSAREAELELKRRELAQAGWRNPLVLSIIAAAIAASGNALVTWGNGMQQRALEDQKSEQARILEMIKTGNADRAAENLKFLVDSGLVATPQMVSRLNDFLKARKPGTGPNLPSPGVTARHTGGMGPLEEGISYNGGDLYDRPSSSPEECSTLCYNDDRCTAATFIRSQQRCWIKSLIGPAGRSSDMVSSRKLAQ